MPQFKLLGFSQKGNTRHFLFQRDDSGDRTACTVLVDLVLARDYKLAVQDLPLYCTRLLHAEADNQPVKTLTLSEEQMKVHAAENDVLHQLDAEKSALRSRRSALAAEARSAESGAKPVGAAAENAPQLLGGR